MASDATRPCTLAEVLLQRFRGRPDYVAIPNGPGFQPQKLDGPLPARWLDRDHLGGNRCFGFYLMNEDNSVFCSAVDFDNKPDNPDDEWLDKAEATYFALAKLGFSPLVEISQSGSAAHVWLFFDEPVEAWLVRKFWSALSDAEDLLFVEIYPRQDRLKPGGLGNLIRYPLWNQSRFVDAENCFETIDPLTALAGVRTADRSELMRVCFDLSGSVPRKIDEDASGSDLSPRVAKLTSRSGSLLNRRWRGDMEGLRDESRSALVMSIACELVRHFVPTGDIQQAVRVWCDKNDYDKGRRDDWIESTVLKAYALLTDRPAAKEVCLTMRDATVLYLERLRNGEVGCVASGISELDRSVDGVAPGEVAIVAARPSHGKTAFAMQWLDRAALAGVKSLIISEEMAAAELGKRALLSISKLSQEEWATNIDDVIAESDAHYDLREMIHVAENCNTIDEVERVVDAACAVDGVSLVAVDYLQLLNSDQNSRYENVTDISRRLKKLAMKNRIAMLVLCQLNREVDKREKHVPQLSDLRESGQIEQDADLVLMLQWPLKLDIKADPTEYRVYCRKRRNGPIREELVFTSFDPARQLFGADAAATQWQPEPGEYEMRFPA